MHFFCKQSWQVLNGLTVQKLRLSMVVFSFLLQCTWMLWELKIFEKKKANCHLSYLVSSTCIYINRNVLIFTNLVIIYKILDQCTSSNLSNTEWIWRRSRKTSQWCTIFFTSHLIKALSHVEYEICSWGWLVFRL